MSVASGLVRSSARTIRRVGAPCILFSQGTQTFNSTTRVNSTVETPYNTYATFDSTSMVTLGQVFGEGLIQASDFLITLPGDLPVDPKQTDRLQMNGKYYEIIMVKPVYYNNIPVIFRVLGRSGDRAGQRALVV